MPMITTGKIIPVRGVLLMHMDRIELQRLKEAARADTVAGVDGPPRVARPRDGQADGVDLSPEAKELAQLLDVARGLSDVRDDHIRSLQARIAAGTYAIPLEALARRLLDHGPL